MLLHTSALVELTWKTKIPMAWHFTCGNSCGSSYKRKKKKSTHKVCGYVQSSMHAYICTCTQRSEVSFVCHPWEAGWSILFFYIVSHWSGNQWFSKTGWLATPRHPPSHLCPPSTGIRESSSHPALEAGAPGPHSALSHLPSLTFNPWLPTPLVTCLVFWLLANTFHQHLFEDFQ